MAPKKGPKKGSKGKAAKAAPAKKGEKGEGREHWAARKIQSNTVNRALAKLEKSGRGYPRIAYKACSTWEQKRDFAQKLVLDPKASFLSLEEESYMQTKTEHTVQGGWLHVWDICKIHGVSYSPGDKLQQKWLAKLVENCVWEPSEEHEGERVYAYSAKGPTKWVNTSGKTLVGKKKCKASVEEFVEAEKMMADVASSSSARFMEQGCPDKRGAAKRSVVDKQPAAAKVKKEEEGRGGGKKTPKEQWYAWANAVKAKLASVLDLGDQVTAVLGSNSEEAWYSGNLAKALAKEVDHLRACHKKVTSLTAMMTLAAPEAFTADSVEKEKASIQGMVEAVGKKSVIQETKELLIFKGRFQDV